MGQPTAHQNSMVVGVDTHMVMVPTPGGPVPVPLPHPFAGAIQSGTVSTVKIGGQPAATKDSIAKNNPPHIPTPPGVSFQSPPDNEGKVFIGSSTVKAGGKALARLGDKVETCNFPSPMPVSTIVSGAVTVLTG